MAQLSPWASVVLASEAFPRPRLILIEYVDAAPLTHVGLFQKYRRMTPAATAILAVGQIGECRTADHSPSWNIIPRQWFYLVERSEGRGSAGMVK